jgi:hypothetical protein
MKRTPVHSERLVADIEDSSSVTATKAPFSLLIHQWSLVVAPLNGGAGPCAGSESTTKGERCTWDNGLHPGGHPVRVDDGRDQHVESEVPAHGAGHVSDRARPPATVPGPGHGDEQD